MLSLYIVRHGQTYYNLERKVQGWCNSDLTELGKQQAQYVHDCLKNIDFVACVTTDMTRAIDTAKIVLGERKIPFIINSKLRELHFGSLETKDIDELLALDESILKTGMRKLNGEDICDLVERYLEGLNECRQFNGNVLVVSHGRAIATVMKAIDPSVDNEEVIIGKSKIVDNCSITRVDDVNGEWKIVGYNLSCEDFK